MSIERINKPLRLTGDQRATFYAGGFPKLTGKSPCPIQVGELIEVSSRVTFKVQAIRWPKPGEWKLEYLVLDNRDDADRYPAARYGVAVNESGQPAPHTKNEELGYTSNPKAALERAAPAVSAHVQNVLTKRCHQDWAVYMAEERSSEVAEQQGKQLVRKLRRLQLDAAKMGVDLTPRLVGMIREAEAELAEKRKAA